eukprot:maker-scaffold_12-snap-gene-7.53-mRNA-1 protein AED:0.13 eAED:0.23 QI:0/0/0.5/1/0/0/2/1898/113
MFLLFTQNYVSVTLYLTFGTTNIAIALFNPVSRLNIFPVFWLTIPDSRHFSITIFENFHFVNCPKLKKSVQEISKKQVSSLLLFFGRFSRGSVSPLFPGTSNRSVNPVGKGYL